MAAKSQATSKGASVELPGQKFAKNCSLQLFSKIAVRVRLLQDTTKKETQSPHEDSKHGLPAFFVCAMEETLEVYQRPYVPLRASTAIGCAGASTLG
jgi:hypothetical protein